MKKLFVVLVLSLALCLAACGQGAPAAEPTAPAQSGAPVQNDEPTESATPVQLANPWREVTEAEAKSLCPRTFAVPDGAENVVWRVMDSAADPSGVPGALVQLSFELYGMDFTAREQVTGDEELDQSGMYYDWTYQLDETLKNWADGTMACHTYRHIGEDGYADLCTWYDTEIGISYSLSVTAKDLDGFDLLAIAEALADQAA